MFHNNTFLRKDLGGLGISYHNGNIHSDFHSTFLEAIFLAVEHLRSCMGFERKCIEKMLKNRPVLVDLFSTGSKISWLCNIPGCPKKFETLPFLEKLSFFNNFFTEVTQKSYIFWDATG